MANKTAKPILEHLWRELTGGEVLHYSEQARLAEASRQLYEEEIQRIGPNVVVPEKVPLDGSYGGNWDDIWENGQMIGLAEGINSAKQELRAKARAFYGIPETEGEAER